MTTPSESELRTTVAILRAQQEATLDGILVVGSGGRLLSHNKRFLEIWGFTAEEAADGDSRLLRRAFELVADRKAFEEGVEHAYAHPDEARSDDRIRLKDGRILSRSSVPVRMSDGEITGRAWYFRDVTAAENAARLQSALFRISELSRTSADLPTFYAAVHGVVMELMDARNLYIAEYDQRQDVLTFPYFADAFDSAPERRPPGRGLTAWVLRRGRPLRVSAAAGFSDQQAEREVDLIGTPAVDWLGVPLKTGDTTWGVLGVQSYDETVQYTEQNREVLVFVAQHIAAAIEQKRNDSALRSSERRYREMFDNNRAIKLLIDAGSGALIDANMAACDFYGYTIEELRAMHIWDINVLDKDQLRQEMSDAAAQERGYFIFRHMRANGEIRDVEVHSGPIEDEGRTLLYSIVHDITERKRAEQALQQSEEKYRDIFNHASVGIMQTTREGQLITANATMARMLGYESVEELHHINVARDLWADPEERARIIAAFEPLGRTTDLEVRWKKKDGQAIWIQLNAHVIRTSSGSTYFEGFIVDISERKRAVESLGSANSQRKAVLDAATSVSIIATDSTGQITVFNSGAERMLGYSAAEMIGNRSLLELHVPDEIASHGAGLSAELNRPMEGFEALTHRAATHSVEEREWTYIRSTGERRTVLVSVTALRDEDGSVNGFLHVGTDITERKQSEELLRKQAAAITASMDGIGILDAELRFTYVNDAMARLFGYARPQLMLSLPLQDLYDGVERDKLETAALPAVRHRSRWRGEMVGRRRDGFSFPQEISMTAIDGGGMVCVVRDITERTYAEEQIKHLAYHDVLTGLPNRLLFKDRLTVALSHAQRDRLRVAVLYLDLDRFKVINDSLGHNVGDQLLQAVAVRIQSCVRESDTIARLGGDEFTLLLPNLTRSEDGAVVAQKILEAIRYPFHIEGREFYTTTSIGISLFPEDGSDALTLIKNADTAMYQAKEQGRDNYQLFNAFVNAKSLHRIALEHGLRKAMINDELAVHYQPIFDLRSGRISGMEALLRWTHPEMGAITPSVFIPIAEGTGMMASIGIWVLRTACAQAKSWHDAGHRNLSLAVNLSVTQLLQADLVDRVSEVLSETGLPARLLELEITESGAMQNPEISVKILYELKKLGIRISLDDFGTGHSSLSYLKRFPVDTLKIDQSFVRDIAVDPDSAAIVTAIIAMAHSLRLKVIAEGVELPEQATFLKRYSCDQMQGYLIKPPVPAEQFLDLINVPA